MFWIYEQGYINIMVITKEIRKRLKAIGKQLDEMRKEYGDAFEFVFIASAYKKNRKFDFGFEDICVLNEDNYRIYKGVIDEHLFRHKERKRFYDYMRLGTFRVICIDNHICQGVMDIFEEKGGDWLKRGETYVVTKVKDSLVDGGLCFELRDLEGKKLYSPYPFEGYNSVRFVPYDYTKLN